MLSPKPNLDRPLQTGAVDDGLRLPVPSCGKMRPNKRVKATIEKTSEIRRQLIKAHKHLLKAIEHMAGMPI